MDFVISLAKTKARAALAIAYDPNAPQMIADQRTATTPASSNIRHLWTEGDRGLYDGAPCQVIEIACGGGGERSGVIARVYQGNNSCDREIVLDRLVQLPKAIGPSQLMRAHLHG